MRIRLRVFVCSSLILSLPISLLGQNSNLTMVVTAAASGEKVRASAPGNVAQIRVQIVSRSGEALFDSSWKDGNVLDWPMQNPADGSYRCTVMVRDLDGQVTQKDSEMVIRGGQIAIEPGSENEDPKVTLLVHDEKTGAIVNTSGDLSFRFGKFFAGKDDERMRLTAEGNLGIGTDKPQARLDVNGVIRASEGIMFSDGTILRTSDGEVVIERLAGPNGGGGGRIIQTVVRSQPAAAPRRLTPIPNAPPDYQFKVDAAGVHIGTTSAFGLDVAGDATLASNLNLPITVAGGTAGVVTFGGTRFAHIFGGGTNTFLGTNAGNFTMSGTNNTGVGQSALFSNVDGTGNTATGLGSMLNNTSGGSNTGSGMFSLHNNTIGSNNTAIGSGALESNTGGNNNVAVGEDALDANLTGSNNIAIGYLAGLSLTGDNNIEIGSQGGAPDSATIRIGTAQTRTFIAGISGKTTGQQNAVPVLIDSNGQLGVTSSSRRFKFDIADMGSATDRLMQLRPVTFRYRQYGDDAALNYGLIAEEVADVYPELVARGNDGQINTVMYQFLAPMLLNEVQQQHRQIEEQRTTIDTLNKTLESLAARIRALEAR